MPLPEREGRLAMDEDLKLFLDEGTGIDGREDWEEEDEEC